MLLPIPPTDWPQLVMSLVCSATGSSARASLGMNLALLPMLVSDWTGLVTSQVGAAMLLLPLQAVVAVVMTFAELITASDVSLLAVAD